MTPVYRSAILRLTLSYLCIVMVISLIFSGVIYKIGHDELAESLHNQSARIYQIYPVFSNDPFFQRTTDVDAGSEHILVNLVYVNLVVLILAGFASYWLAKRTLSPIAEANEQQKRFVADASHELRTPLTAIKMESEVALIDPSASKASLQATLRSNLEEASKLTALVESLLKLSRLETVQGAPLVAADIRPLVAAAVKNVGLQAKAKQITTTTTLAPKLSAAVDHDSFVQLLVILLDNAIKYSQPETTIEIASKLSGDQLLVSVSDHGAGIAPEALEHVFDRFYRADSARTSNNGYGLGLSIAKYIADLHHGTLTLTSTAGKGTTAVVSVPVTDPVLSPSDSAQSRRRTERPQDT